jgi:hypothetical protein
MSKFTDVMFAILFGVAYLGPPILLIWGWLRWTLRPRLWSAFSVMSFVGFCLATLSALLAISSIAYAQVHHFPYYDPLLLRIFRSGALLSLGGIVFGVGGVWRPTPLRWHAPASALAMLWFWTVAASGE